MEKQTVYIPVDDRKAKSWVTTTNGISLKRTYETISVERKENVYILSEQVFEKLIGDAFEAGHNRGTSLYQTPNKTEYLNNLKP